MFELLILLISAPLIYGIISMTEQACLNKKFVNPFCSYISLFNNLKTSYNYNVNPALSSVALASVIIASFVLFNVSGTCDFIIFAGLILLCKLFYSLNTGYEMKKEFITYTSFILAMAAFFTYTGESVFESLLTVKNSNILAAGILTIIFLLLVVNEDFNDEFSEGVDKAFLDYSYMLRLALWGAFIGLMFYSDNIFIFISILLGVSLVAGLLKYFYSFKPAAFKFLLAAASVIFSVLVTLGIK